MVAFNKKTIAAVAVVAAAQGVSAKGSSATAAPIEVDEVTLGKPEAPKEPKEESRCCCLWGSSSNDDTEEKKDDDKEEPCNEPLVIKKDDSKVVLEPLVIKKDDKFVGVPEDEPVALEDDTPVDDTPVIKKDDTPVDDDSATDVNGGDDEEVDGNSDAEDAAFVASLFADEEDDMTPEEKSAFAKLMAGAKALDIQGGAKSLAMKTKAGLSSKTATTCYKFTGGLTVLGGLAGLWAIDYQHLTPALIAQYTTIFGTTFEVAAEKYIAAAGTGNITGAIAKMTMPMFMTTCITGVKNAFVTCGNGVATGVSAGPELAAELAKKHGLEKTARIAAHLAQGTATAALTNAAAQKFGNFRGIKQTAVDAKNRIAEVESMEQKFPALHKHTVGNAKKLFNSMPTVRQSRHENFPSIFGEKKAEENTEGPLIEDVTDAEAVAVEAKKEQ